MKRCASSPGANPSLASRKYRVRVCVFRLVRCLLGQTAIADRKLECGNPLTVLGVSVALMQDGICFKPEPAKIAKWTRQIESALASDRLCAGEASKLACVRFVLFDV